MQLMQIEGEGGYMDSMVSPRMWMEATYNRSLQCIMLDTQRVSCVKVLCDSQCACLHAAV